MCINSCAIFLCSFAENGVNYAFTALWLCRISSPGRKYLLVGLIYVRGPCVSRLEADRKLMAGFLAT